MKSMFCLDHWLHYICTVKLCCLHRSHLTSVKLCCLHHSHLTSVQHYLWFGLPSHFNPCSLGWNLLQGPPMFWFTRPYASSCRCDPLSENPSITQPCDYTTSYISWWSWHFSKLSKNWWCNHLLWMKERKSLCIYLLWCIFSPKLFCREYEAL